ncbi:MAG: hypothetical protein AAF629_34380, partial [Chloroflexota bacterium]
MMTKPQLRKWLSGPLIILLFFLWFLGPTALLLILIIDSEQLPIDYLAYHRATEAIEKTENPYPSPQKAQEIWLTYHQLEYQILTESVPDDLNTINPGPYVYPPTLALGLVRLNIGASVFIVLLLLSIFGFGWLLTKANTLKLSWLLLIVISWDVLAEYLGGNVELLLLFLSLATAWLIWRQQAIWAAPMLAFIILTKPFYTQFFVAFGLFMLVNDPNYRIKTLRSLILLAGVTIALIGVEIASWGSRLRLQASTYFSDALEYQWWVLPLEQQTPMSIWNRTALQGLVNAGLPIQTAQYMSIGVWLLLVIITAWALRNRALNFAVLFALSFVLLYWGRPVGWGLIYLDIVVLSAIWPATQARWERWVILGLALALALSHWVALILTATGQWLRLFTLQNANVPWETWLVLPLCWLLLIIALPRLATGSQPNVH